MNITYWLLFVLFALQSAAVFWLWRRLLMIESERVVEASTFDHLQRQISALQRTMQEISTQQVVPATLPHVPEFRQQPAAATEGASPYNQAVEMFKRGLGSADVAERCGISRSEAELILSLYRNSPTS